MKATGTFESMKAQTLPREKSPAVQKAVPF